MIFENSTLFLNADNANIYRYVTENEHCMKLQDDIDSLNQLADTRQLKFNVSKCNLIITA